MPVLIRPFAPRDIEAVTALNNANVPELSELDSDGVVRLVAMADTALVAEVDGSFAGFCWVLRPGCDYESLNYAWFSRTYDDFAYLDRIAVESEFRRYGIGRAFYAALVERYSGVHARITCEVNTRPMNERSLAFHHALGFVEVGQQDTDGGTKSVSLLSLELAARD